jgi:two-component system, OmpR family, sensor histidine kinase VicK
MPDQRTRSLKILAMVQAVVSGLVAVVIFAFFGLNRSAIGQTNTLMTAAILGTVGVVFYLTLHQLLSKTRLALSTLILSMVTAINAILVIASTGGLDSPFYSLWLLAIVTAGLFGSLPTIAVLGLTIAYYAYELFATGLNTPYLKDHLIQLGITLIAGGLAEWVHARNRKALAGAGTELRALSGQLSTAELKADAVMAYIGEGVMVVDATRKIQLFNKAAQDLAGWDEESARNIDYNLVLQLKTAADQPLADGTDPFTAAWSTAKTIIRDNLSITSRTGRKIQVSLTVSPIFESAGKPSGAVALFRDISREKEVEREKDEFVSTASHEMRTPVAAIEGYLSLAMNPNVATIDERAKKYLDKAHESIGHLGNLFRDLLSVTKAEEGSMNAKIEPVNLAELLQSTVEDMKFTADKKNLTIVYQIGSNQNTGKAIAPLYYVAANPERLREVMMNLVDNAIKFTVEGGIKVTIDGSEKEVSVGVQDTGYGIDPADIPHLFQKFYRVDNSATRTIGGTGLGLYLCRRVIELFNGRIWVESKPGEGSTFRFTLPRLSQEEVARMQNEAPSSNGQTSQPAPSTPAAPAPAAPAAPAPSATPAAAPAPAAEAPMAVAPEAIPGQEPDASADAAATPTAPIEAKPAAAPLKIPVDGVVAPAKASG